VKSARYLYFSSFCLDRRGEQLWNGAQQLPLRRKPLAMLRYLADHSGELVTKEDLLDAVWPGVQVSEGVLTVDIREVRKVLGDDARSPRFIETVHGRGYRFIGKVVSGQSSVVSPSPMPPLRSQLATGNWQPTTPLVGRDAELSQLHHWLGKALGGDRQIVFITGEPGIGKTTLIDAFLQSLASSVRNGEERQKAKACPEPSRRGKNQKAKIPDSEPQSLAPNTQHPTAPLWVGCGQCIEHYGAGEAYLPVLEALGRLCREPCGQRLVALLHQYAPTWLAQMPALLTAAEREQLQRGVRGATRERMLRELAEALEALTAERPLVLVLEDLHWSDVSTLELLASLARRQEAARLIIVGTYRPVEVLSTGHPLRRVTQELLSHNLCAELTLPLLTTANVAMYLQTRFLHSRFPTQLPQTLQRRTEGNPFFLVNVVDDLVARGAFVQGDSDWTLQDGVETLVERVPENIRQLVAKQSERLSRSAQYVLKAASVAGMEFSAAAVAAALACDVVAVEEQCAALVERQQFLRRAGISEWPDGTMAARYGFLHSLYQQLWHEQVGVNQLQRWHLRIGQCKEMAYGDRASEIATELAVHFEQGRDYHRALQYLHQAGGLASRRSAYQEAIEHLTKALELLKTFPGTLERTRQELMLRIILGPALVATKGYAAPEVEKVYARARELCQQVEEVSLLFPALYGLWTFHNVRAELQTAHELGEQLLNLAQTAQDPILLLEAHRALGANLHMVGEFASALEHLERGITLYDSQQHDSQTPHTPVDLGVACRSRAALALWSLGYPDQALTRIHEALTRAQQLSHPFTLAFVLTWAAWLHQFRREEHLMKEKAEVVIKLCSEQGFPFLLAQGMMYRGQVLVTQKQGEEGIAQICQGLAILQAPGIEPDPDWLARLATAYAAVGQVQEGLTVLTEALEVVDKTEERTCEAELYRLRGQLVLQSRVQSQNKSRQVEASQGKPKHVQSPESENPNPQSLTPNPQAKAEAEACFLKAIEIARKQQAKSLELRAVMSLARLWQSQDKMAEAHQMLSEIYGWFTEGFDTKDLQEAKALLQELAERQ